MIIDSSVIVAVLLKEPGWQQVFEKLVSVEIKGIGTPTLAEAGIVISARIGFDARALLSRFLQEFNIIPIPFGELHWLMTVEAYQRFGKGRHPASLNFGDCMSYATAKLAQRPLHCLGKDFSRTDIMIA